MEPRVQGQREKIAKFAAEIIADVGCSSDVLKQASLSAGHDENLGDLLFINGIFDLIAYYFEQEQNYVLSKLKDSQTNSIGAKVQMSLEASIGFWHFRHKLLTKIISFLSLPWNLPYKIKLYWNYADFVWSEILNDGSTDFNYYSKRSILNGVYSTSLFYMLTDNSKDAQDTLEFMHRQLKRVHEFGKFIQPLKKKFS